MADDAPEQVSITEAEVTAGPSSDARHPETAEELTADRPSDVTGTDEADGDWAGAGAGEESTQKDGPQPGPEPGGELDAKTYSDTEADATGAPFDRQQSDTTPNRSPGEQPKEDGPAPDVDSRWRSELPAEEIEQLYAKKVRPMLYGDGQRQDTPAREPDEAGAKDSEPHVVAFIGGPPGVGKSEASKKVKGDIRDEYGSDPLVIDADTLRRHHPDYTDVMASSPRDMPHVTAQAIARWTEMAIGEAHERGQNVIIEGTFRNPDTLLSTAARFAPGWKREVHVVAEPEEVSRLGTVSRTLSEGRSTPAAAHDEAFANNPTTVREAFGSGLFHRITLSTRSERVMESTGGPEEFAPGSAEFGERLREIRTAPMTPEKAHGHLKAFDETMRGYISADQVNRSTAPDLSRVTRDAMGVRSGLDLGPSERDAFAAEIYSYQLNIEFPDKIHKFLGRRDPR
ncbi:zeta toxin family protein [Streptomyces sp. NPDC057697]|uniref:zeta toxin family protein n=1 Tax=Streptomyces sp. NPDC057697 TaxID=3346219 RepID=UPI00368B0330